APTASAAAVATTAAAAAVVALRGRARLVAEVLIERPGSDNRGARGRCGRCCCRGFRRRRLRRGPGGHPAMRNPAHHQRDRDAGQLFRPGQAPTYKNHKTLLELAVLGAVLTGISRNILAR